MTGWRQRGLPKHFALPILGAIPSTLVLGVVIMGHLRMGRLPKTRRWTQVVDLLDAGSLDTGALAAAVLEAADYRLRQLANDQGLGYSFWLLTRIALAARGDTFVGDLSRLGITAGPGLSSLQFIAQVTDRAREEISTGIPQIKPTFLDIAPSGIPSNIIPHSKGVKCGLIRSNSPFSYSNHRPAKPKIPKPLVYAQVSPLGTSFATP